LVRANFEAGDIVKAKFPIQISPISGNKVIGELSVFLQTAETQSKSTELFIRQDLSIDKEKSFKSIKRLVPAKALTLIDDDSLSRFLAAAEEPTHREWNGSRPKLSLHYKGAAATLRAVRNAASRFLELLAPPPAKDNLALASFFPDHQANMGVPNVRKKKDDNSDGNGKPKIELPPPKPKLVELVAEDDGASIKVNPGFHAEFVAAQCEIVFAYATELGNAFMQWDAADFYLTSKNVVTNGVVEQLEVKENTASFILGTSASSVKIYGFDPKRQLEMKLKYRELEDAHNISD
jgi:hypothetical protein